MVSANQQIVEPRRKGGRPKGSGPTPASWKPGQCGNPNAISDAGKVARQLMAATVEVRDQLAERIVQQALNGCLQSQRLLVERFMPQVRAQTLAQPLPGIEQGSIEQRLQAVLAAAAEGKISADEARVLVDSIRGATEAASIAAAERELQTIRELRQRVLTNGQQAPQIAPGAIQAVEEVPRHV